MQQVINGVVLGSIYVLFASGLSLAWGTVRVLNMAHAAVFMFAGFVCYLVTVKAGINLGLPLLILIGIAVGCTLEVALDILVFRVIRSRMGDIREEEASMLLASIGASTILVALASGDTAGAPFAITPQPVPTHLFHVGGSVITSVEIAVVVISLVLSIGLAIWLGASRHGRALRSLAADPETSKLMGVNESRLSAVVFLISGATAGVAGVLLAVYLDSISAQSGQDYLLEAFAAVVIGGVGSIWGTIAGGFILAAAETIVAALTNGLWTDGVAFGLIIIILVARPNGLFGSAEVDRT